MRKLRLRWPRAALTGTLVARLLEEAYDEARAVVALAEAGDGSLSRRQVMRAEGIVLGCESARLHPDRPWTDPTMDQRRAAIARARRREAQVAGVQTPDPPTVRIHTRGAQS